MEPPFEEDRDRCEVTFLGIDLTDRSLDGAKAYLEDQQRTVDSIAAAVDLRPSFDEWSNTLQAPVDLADWVRLVLAPAPESVCPGVLPGSADSLWVDLVVEGRVDYGTASRLILNEIAGTELRPGGRGAFLREPPCQPCMVVRAPSARPR